MSEKYSSLEYDGIKQDELQAAGDGVPVFTYNITTSSSAEFERGDIVCATSPTGTFKLATATDTGYFGIVRDDFKATSDLTVCQAYVSGRFHREKLNKYAGTDTSVVDALELEMKRQNIWLTSIR